MFKLNFTNALIIILIAMSILLYGIHSNSSLKTEIIEEQKNTIANLNGIIDENNQIIKGLEIDVENYKNREPVIREKIVEKYREIKVKDEKCESKIEAISDLLDVFVEKDSFGE